MKPKLMIDMDGVCVDFNRGIRKYAPDLNSHDWDETRDLVDSICENNPTIFHDLEPIEHSIEYIKELFKIYDVYFLSTPMWNVPISYTGKRIWLEKHFGSLAEKRLILTHRKDLVIGDFLIDDTKRNGAGEFKGEHIHIFTEIFPDWKSVYDYLVYKSKLPADKQDILKFKDKNFISNLLHESGDK